MTVHAIQISEPWDFTHPNGSNEFTARGVAVIGGSGEKNWGRHFYLLDVESPFEIDGEIVRQLVCCPRYSGDSMAMVVGASCTVGFARVKPELTLSSESVANSENVVYCAIGSISIT